MSQHVYMYMFGRSSPTPQEFLSPSPFSSYPRSSPPKFLPPLSCPPRSPESSLPNFSSPSSTITTISALPSLHFQTPPSPSLLSRCLLPSPSSSSFLTSSPLNSLETFSSSSHLLTSPFDRDCERLHYHLHFSLLCELLWLSSFPCSAWFLPSYCVPS